MSEHKITAIEAASGTYHFTNLVALPLNLRDSTYVPPAVVHPELEPISLEDEQGMLGQVISIEDIMRPQAPLINILEVRAWDLLCIDLKDGSPQAIRVFYEDAWRTPLYMGVQEESLKYIWDSFQEHHGIYLKRLERLSYTEIILEDDIPFIAYEHRLVSPDKLGISNDAAIFTYFSDMRIRRDALTSLSRIESPVIHRVTLFDDIYLFQIKAEGKLFPVESIAMDTRTAAWLYAKQEGLPYWDAEYIRKQEGSKLGDNLEHLKYEAEQLGREILGTSQVIEAITIEDAIASVEVDEEGIRRTELSQLIKQQKEFSTKAQQAEEIRMRSQHNIAVTKFLRAPIDISFGSLNEPDLWEYFHAPMREGYHAVKVHLGEAEYDTPTGYDIANKAYEHLRACSGKLWLFTWVTPKIYKIVRKALIQCNPRDLTFITQLDKYIITEDEYAKQYGLLMSRYNVVWEDLE